MASLPILDRTPRVVLHHGDCLEVMRKLPDGCADVTITSPPYNLSNSLGRDGKLIDKFTNRKGKWKTADIAKGYASYRDCLPHSDYVEWQKECLREMWRLTADDGVIFYNHKPRIQNGEAQLPTDLNPGLPLRQIVIWNRGQGMNFGPAHFVPHCEWILVFAKRASASRPSRVPLAMSGISGRSATKSANTPRPFRSNLRLAPSLPPRAALSLIPLWGADRPALPPWRLVETSWGSNWTAAISLPLGRGSRRPRCDRASAKYPHEMV